MGIEKELLPILAVALLTWGGVLAYMIRLDRSTRELERRLGELEQGRAGVPNIAAEREVIG